MADYTKVCPNCGDETIAVNLVRDSDGDAEHTRYFTTVEVVDIECGCDLTAEQVGAIEDEVGKEFERDGYPEREP